jgi:6-phosphogluconolactonase (cycloisomerase 2 family)
MKGIGMGQQSKARVIKTLVASLAVGLGMTACSRDYTADYLYVTSALKPTGTPCTASTTVTCGVVNAYEVDYSSGDLTPLADSPIPSGGNDPVGLVASPNSKYIYVINNAAPSSNVVEFSVGTDGKLYPENTYPVVQNANATIIGSFPTAIAVDPSGTFLYITFTYQNGYSATNPGPGGVAVFPINSDGSLGSPVMNGTLPYFPVGDNPVGIVASPNTTPASQRYVYVIDQETPASGSPYGVLLTFAASSTGVLTAVPGTGTLSGGTAAGTTPAGIAEDPGGHFLYISDETTNQLYGFLSAGTPVTVGGNTYNLPVPFTNAQPATTGINPEGVTVDPRGLYVYVANFGSDTVSAFAINTGNGTLASVAGASSNAVATGPTCVAIEPALGIYLYTSNNIDSSISGLQLNPHTGALSGIQGTKFSASALPTCAVAIANGAHATQIVQ